MDVLGGAGKDPPALSAFLQGLAGERGVTGPAVSGGCAAGPFPGHRAGVGGGSVPAWPESSPTATPNVA